jgi:hypothetical protein
MSLFSASHRVAACGWLLALATLWLAWRTAHKHGAFIPTDLDTWQADWQTMLSCLGGERGNGPCSVSKFPLSYLLNAGLYSATA